jgi:hypothetical protein
VIHVEVLLDISVAINPVRRQVLLQQIYQLSKPKAAVERILVTYHN